MTESSSINTTNALDRRLLAVYGPLIDGEARVIRTAASALDLEAAFFDSPAALGTELERRLPVAILVEVDCDGALEVLTHLRGSVRYAATALLGLASDRTDAAFGAFFDRGGDDLVSPRSVQGLVNRIHPLISRAPPPAALRSPGYAVVATSDLRWRNIVARTLSNVGIESRIVGNGPDAVDAACGPALFVVASDDLLPDGGAASLAAARARGSNVPWLIAAPGRRAGAIRAALKGHAGATVVDAFAPPDNLLFTANELRRPQLSDQRAHARILFGTAVSFRVAGGAEDDVGFTYNLSSSGMFVRTLAPLDAGQEVWLEVWPPCIERATRLLGRVAWRRAFGPNESATVPPGFGIQLTGGLPGDLERWEAGARTLLADPLAPQLRPDVALYLSSAPPPWLSSLRAT